MFQALLAIAGKAGSKVVSAGAGTMARSSVKVIPHPPPLTGARDRIRVGRRPPRRGATRPPTTGGGGGGGPPSGDLGHGRVWSDHAAGALQAAWGLDLIAGRLDTMFPQFVESVSIRVWGQRWATVEDLYVLGMSLLVSAVDGAHWWGDQHIRCSINRTAKYVEIDFIQSKRGMVDNLSSLAEPFGQSASQVQQTVADILAAAGGPILGGLAGALGNKAAGDVARIIGMAGVAGIGMTPFKKFHNPDWLNNELHTLTKEQAVARMPDLLSPTQLPGPLDLNGVGQVGLNVFAQGFLNQAHLHKDAGMDVLLSSGGFTANRVANQPPGVKLVTHETDVNPHLQFDGRSRGTDLISIVTALIQDPLAEVPTPETDSTWVATPEPQPPGEWEVMPNYGGRYGSYVTWWATRGMYPVRTLAYWAAGFFGWLFKPSDPEGGDF